MFNYSELRNFSGAIQVLVDVRTLIQRSGCTNTALVRVQYVTYQHYFPFYHQRRACTPLEPSQSMNRFNFISPARIKVALVPIGSILPLEYSSYSQAIAAISNIRLLDISPIPDCRYFNPQEYTQGRLLYDIGQVQNDDDMYLHEFEPFRKTFIVLGVATHQLGTDTINHFKERFPSAIVHNIICFKSPLKEDLGDKNPDVFHVSEEAEKNITTIETVICEISRNFLLALDIYAASFENVTLRSPISMTNSNMLTRTINQAQKALASSSSYKVSFTNGQSSQSKDLKVKASQRQTGRQAKLMGNFFLLAGRSQNALQYFTDAAINAKKAEDYLWLASSLDGLSVSIMMLLYLNLPSQVQNSMLWPLLQVLKTKSLSLGRNARKSSSESKTHPTSSPRTSMTSNKSFGSLSSNGTTDLSQMLLLDTLLFLTLRSSYFYQMSTSDVEDCVPDMVYIESLLRNIKFMVAVFLAGSSNTKMIVNSIVDSVPVERSRDPESSLLARGEILNEIDKIFALQLVQLEFAEQCSIYCTLASIYNDLGYYRKQGFILRILLLTLQPKLWALEKTGSVGELCTLLSVSQIIEILFLTYHMDTETEILSSSANSHYTDSIALQLLLLKICLRIAESLQDHLLLAKLCILTFARFSHCLPNEDQIKIKEKLDWLTLYLVNESSHVHIPHPDPFIIRDLKFVVPQVYANTPQLFSLDDDMVGNPEDSAVIFNPFEQTGSKSANLERVICLNETNHLKMSLQNPFAFPLKLKGAEVVAANGFNLATIESLVKLLSYTNFESARERTNNWRISTKNKVLMEPETLELKPYVTVPANSLAVILVSFRALDAGDFEITGLNLTLGNSRPQFFNIVSEENVSSFEKLSYRKHEPIKKDTTLERLMSNLSGGNIAGRASTKTITLTASYAQPTLSFIDNLVANGWAMLLEGEYQKHSITLKNTSLEVVNYLSFSLWDSTVDPINAKLSSGQTYSTLSAEETYELEWRLLKQKSIEVTNKAEIASKYKEIQPGGDLHIELALFGKRAMVSLKLLLQYANKRESDLGGRYLRNLVVPFNTSVVRSAEIINCEIYHFSPFYFEVSPDGYMADGKSLASVTEFVTRIASSHNEDVSDYCVLALDVRNFWKFSLAVRIQSCVHREKYVSEEQISPNCAAKIMLPVRKLGLSQIDINKRIPSLRNKQYIKNRKITEDEKYQAQLCFWVRHELLKCLEATWTTLGLKHERRGEIDLRRLHVNSSMINLLTTGSILIYQTIVCEENSNQNVEMKDNTYELRREEFYILRTRLVNHTDHPLSGTFRHVPVPTNLGSKHEVTIDSNILYNGSLQVHLKEGTIAAKGEYEMSLGFLVLESGLYEWGCIFDIANKERERVVDVSPIFIKAY